MKVYRVEDQEGNGPWGNGADNRNRRLVPMLSIYGGDPRCHNIPGMGYGDHRKFACHTIPCFAAYWPSPEGRKKLVDAGARLAVYEVPDSAVAICQYETQCVFEPAAARLVAVLDPETLEEKEIGNGRTLVNMVAGMAEEKP